MSEELKEKVEFVFQSSSNPDELFDSLNLALQNKIDDIELYKTLLANPFLNVDEVKMFCSKLCDQFPQHAYDLFLWSAKIFETSPNKFNAINSAIDYYKYASMIKPDSVEPYLLLAKNYNFEVETEVNEEIMLTLNDGLKYVSEKSKIYRTISDIFRKKELKAIADRYCALAEEEARKERRLRNSNL